MRRDGIHVCTSTVFVSCFFGYGLGLAWLDGMGLRYLTTGWRCVVCTHLYLNLNLNLNL